MPPRNLRYHWNPQAQVVAARMRQAADIMETIGNYPDLASARIAQSILTAADIESEIPDEYLSGVDWQMNTALHGVRLLVHADDAAAARSLLTPGEHEGIDQPPEPDEPAERCPSCGSENVGPAPWKRRFKGLSMLFWPLLLLYPLFAFLLPARACLACGKTLRSSAA